MKFILKFILTITNFTKIALGLIGGIWLAFLGEWNIIGYGIVALFIANFALGFAMLPSLLFAVPASNFLDNGKKLFGYFFGLLSSAYTTGILVIWCAVILLFLTEKSSINSFMATLFWSYGIATGPIDFLTQKDSQAGNDGSIIPNLFIHVGYVLMIGSILLFDLSIINALLLLSVIMIASIVFQFFYLLETNKNGNI